MMSSEHELLPIAQVIQAGIEHHQAGRLAEAEDSYHRVLQIDPANAEAMHLLGVIAGQLGNIDAAVEMIGKAVALQPSNTHFLNNFGTALKNAGQWVEAEQAYRKVLALAPGYTDAHYNLGILLQGRARHHEAAQSFRTAVDLNPDSAHAHSELGIALHDLGRPDEAEQSIRRALALKDDFALAHNNLAHVLQSLGRLEEAELSYRRSLALDPGNAGTHSTLLFLLNYLPAMRPADIYAEHRAFARRFGTIANPAPHANLPDRARRLRIGYVSGDLRDHAVAFFIEPVLARHDHGSFEIFCYFNFVRSDAVTRRLQPLADHWREVVALDDEALAGLIRDDAIDILVDLSGHTMKNRLQMFARKPAPVQATWLGYLNTTGLDAMDYRITDAQASPVGPLDALHSEKLMRLPDSQWCYRPPSDCPEVSPPPSAASGRITFAAFANPAKIAQPMIELWGRLLGQVPGSRLLVAGAKVTAIPGEFPKRFSNCGITADRVQFMEFRPLPAYLALHGTVDIILDTFPYSGGTTTCHALWMGVPVVTLAGDTATSRGGASLLHAVGLDELVAHTPEQYLDIAAALAASPQRLAALRAGMRERMAASPLMDEARFTRHLEQAYRAMWQTWCAAATAR